MEREVYTNANNMADYVAGIQKLVAHFTNQKAQGSRVYRKSLKSLFMDQS